jgi:hypothetical protein
MGRAHVIDQCYLASVADVRNLCAELTNYSVEVIGGRAIVTHGNQGDMNTIKFAFPIVTAFWFLGIPSNAPEVGKLVCMDRKTAKQIRKSLHLWEDGEVRSDPLSDWDIFWAPLEALLFREFETFKH